MELELEALGCKVELKGGHRSSTDYATSGFSVPKSEKNRPGIASPKLMRPGDSSRSPGWDIWDVTNITLEASGGTLYIFWFAGHVAGTSGSQTGEC